MLGAECASTPRGPTNVPARLLGASRAAGTWGARKHDAPPTTDSADDALRAPHAREGQRSAQAARCRRAHKSAAQRVTTRFSHEKGAATRAPDAERGASERWELQPRRTLTRASQCHAAGGARRVGVRPLKGPHNTPHASRTHCSVTGRGAGATRSRRAPLANRQCGQQPRKPCGFPQLPAASPLLRSKAASRELQNGARALAAKARALAARAGGQRARAHSPAEMARTARRTRCGARARARGGPAAGRGPGGPRSGKRQAQPPRPLEHARQKQRRPPQAPTRAAPAAASRKMRRPRLGLSK